MDYCIVRDVQTLYLKIQEDIERATNGIPLERASSIPSFLTKEKVLQIYAKLVKVENDKVREYVEELDGLDWAFWSDTENVLRVVSNFRVIVKTHPER